MPALPAPADDHTYWRGPYRTEEWRGVPGARAAWARANRDWLDATSKRRTWLLTALLAAENETQTSEPADVARQLTERLDGWLRLQQ